MASALALLAAVPALPLTGAPSGGTPVTAGTGQGLAPGPPSEVSCHHVARCPSTPALTRGTGAELSSVGYLANRTMGWSEITLPPASLGSGGGMVADSQAATAFYFGGESSGRLANTTFSYSEATNSWSTVAATNAPSPRSDFAFAFDPGHGAGVLFGGLTNLTTLAVSNQTFSYNVTTGHWTPHIGGAAPAAREASAFAVSSSLDLALLYGGWNRNYSGTESITYSDLWELNLTTFAWSGISASGVRPPPLENAAMLWNPSTHRFELFGGCFPCSSAVWQFDPTSLRWTELAPSAGGPAARAGAGWAYDPTLGADLLYGGANGGVWFNDTYLFYPGRDSWVVQTLLPRPAARSDAATGFLDVPGNETWLLEGGGSGTVTYSDLWRLSTTSNVSVEVRNASSLLPLKGAEVNLSGRTAGFSNTNGSLNLTQVDAVDQAFGVSEFGYFTRNTTLWLAPGRLTNLTVDLTPEPPGTVFVTVLSSFGSPLPNAAVNLTVNGTRVNLLPAFTDVEGNASFHGVPPGRVNVTVTAPSDRPNHDDGVLVAGGELNATVQLVPDPLLSVSVLGRFPGGFPIPLNQAAVFLNGTEIGLTDPTGGLNVFTTEFGLESLQAQAPAFAPAVSLVAIPWTGSVNASLTLTSLPFGLLLVSVVSSVTHGAVPNASVSAVSTIPLPSGPYGSANYTDRFGNTGLSLPQGEYSVTAAAVGYVPSNITIVVVLSDARPTITFYLIPVPPGTVHFLVRDTRSGSPIPEANVTFGNGLGGRTNHSGFYNTTLPPTTYFVVVTAAGYLPNSTVVVLHSNDNRTVIVNLTQLPMVSVPGGWRFVLFSSGLGDLWPFLALPALLVVGAFVYGSVLRAKRGEEEPVPPSTIQGRGPDASGPPTGRSSEPGSLPPPS